jgi:hypothetical protein
MANENKREDALGVLFDETIDSLLKRVKSGEATPGDYKNIIQLLKDNGITAEIRSGSPLEELSNIVPFAGENFRLRAVGGE